MKKINLLLFTATMIILVFFIKGNTENIKINKYAFVTVKVLNFRDKPGKSGKKIGAFVLADKVKVLKKSMNKERIGRYNDYWYEVKKDNKQGWLYGAFISMKIVNTAEDQKMRLKGDYVANFPATVSTIKIYGNTYKHTISNPSSGVTTEYTGDVEYQAKDIIFKPKVKVTKRRLDYSDNPYSNPYSNSSTRDEIKRYSSRESKSNSKRYYILECRGTIILSTQSSRSSNCARWQNVYKKR